MAKMTQELIEKLYALGKNVYEKNEDIGKAVSVELISESSAKFYIGLVNELIIGKGSTWNQNSDLLVYYVEKKIKNLIICINTGTLSNMNENTKEIYH